MHMKCIAAVSLGALLASSAWAQHGGAAGHAGGGFSSGHSFSAPASGRSFGSAPSYRPNMSAQHSFPYSSPAPFGGTYPYHGGATRHPYPPYSGRVYRPYYSRGAYLVPGWLGSGFYDSGYGSDYSDQQEAAPPASDAYTQQGPSDDQAYAPAPARPAYQGDSPASSDLQEPPQVTLVFKDGRPQQVVQNYAVTRSTLYVLDGVRRREIPLDQLDLPQTEKTNRDAGVDFEVPEAAE
jgi:hypothetical protein